MHRSAFLARKRLRKSNKERSVRHFYYRAAAPFRKSWDYVGMFNKMVSATPINKG